MYLSVICMLGREVINSLTPLTGSVWMSQLFSAGHSGVPDTTRRLVSANLPENKPGWTWGGAFRSALTTKEDISGRDGGSSEMAEVIAPPAQPNFVCRMKRSVLLFEPLSSSALGKKAAILCLQWCVSGPLGD